jgi:energy-coupling factor transporter ATP-binding protein EcfA2/energy-coupling factor transporter transmembrane protein EcfT
VTTRLAAVSVAGLTVTRLGNERPTLSGLTFNVAAGERVLVVGPSASGKSTLLQVLSGALEPLGVVEIDGSYRLDEAGLLLQNPQEATVAESVYRDVAFGAENAGIASLTIAELVEKSLTDVGLRNLVEGGPGRSSQALSGGELQRVCLAGLLALKPRVLLLDEPTSHLDDAAAAEVRNAVLEYLEQSGAACVIVEHRFEPWLPVVNRVLVLGDSGQIVADGSWTDVFAAESERLVQLGLWLPDAGSNFELDSESPGSSPSGGRIVALVGPSGSGKSTHIRQLMATHLAGGENQQNLGWLPQNPRQILWGSNLIDSVLGRSAIKCTDEDCARAEKILDQLGVPRESWWRSPQEVSGGQQRLVALAAVLYAPAQLLLLDEPTVGLDTHAWNNAVGLMLKARDAGVRVVIATHDAELLRLADEVVEFAANCTAATSLPPASKPSSISPLAAIGASLILLIGALFFRTPMAALAALTAEVAVLLAVTWFVPSLRAQLRWRASLLIPVVVGVVSVGFSNWWLSTSRALEPALLIALRTAFFGLPSVLLASAISTSWLGDQLAQKLHLPARPVVAAMIGLNRAKRLGDDWQNMALARKIRGTARRGLVEWSQLTLLALLEATRSAMTLSVAMEARGFGRLGTDGKPTPRTWAETARWGRFDAAVLALALVLVAIGLFSG